jgi:hypothetical protein
LVCHKEKNAEKIYVASRFPKREEKGLDGGDRESLV